MSNVIAMPGTTSADRAKVLRDRARYAGLLTRLGKQSLALLRPERELRSSQLRTSIEVLEGRHRRIVKGENEIGMPTMFQPHPKLRTLNDVPEVQNV